MFRNLKKKLEQGVAQSPLRAALASYPKPSNEKLETQETPPCIQKADNFSAKGSGDTREQDDATKFPPVSGEVVAVGQLIDIPLNEEADGEQQNRSVNSEQGAGEETPHIPLSRHSSISSMTSESPFTPLHYQLPSDIESEVEESNIKLENYSKDDLYVFIKKYERRALRYKSKFVETVTLFKELLQERDKLKTTLTKSQDNSFRRISEMKEQLQLGQLAKRDLEENYRLMLEEKDEQVKVLQTQVRLLKEGKDLPPETRGAENTPIASPPQSPKNQKGDNSEADFIALQEKVKRLEGLLNKCRETIKINKEKTTYLSQERNELQQQLNEKVKELETLKTAAVSVDMQRLQGQIRQARQVIEQLETDREIAIAEVKQQVHTTVEEKDKELLEAHQLVQSLRGDNNWLREQTTASQDRFDKLEEKIRQLEEEKKNSVAELEEKLRRSEQSMEEEKSDLVQELSRGKTAAISLMQEESEKRLEEKLLVATQELEQVWQEKLACLEKSFQENLAAKEKEQKLAFRQEEEEFQLNLLEREEEMRLAVEECELQKTAALSQQKELKDQLQSKIDAFKSEKIELENQVSQLHASIDAIVEENRMNIEKLVKENNELEEQHKQRNAEMQREHEQKLQERVECLIQMQTKQIEELTSKHEEAFHGSNVEIEAYYKGQVESVKLNFDQLLAERTSQLEIANQMVQEYKDKLAVIQGEFESRTQEFETRLAELQKSVKAEQENYRKVLKEMENIKIQYEESEQMLKAQLNKSNADVLAKEEEKKQLQEVVMSLQDKVLTVKEEWGVKCMGLEKDKEDMQRLLEEKQLLEKDWKQRLGDVKSEQEEVLSEAEKRVAKLEGDLERLQSEIEIAKDAKKMLEAVVLEKEGKEEDIEATMQSLLRSNEELNQKLEGINIAQEEWNKERDGLLLQITTLHQDLDAKIDCLKIVEADRSSRDKEIASLVSYQSEIDEKVGNLEKEIEQKSSVIAEKLAELEKSKEKFQLLKVEAKGKIKELREQIEKQSQEHAEKLGSVEQKWETTHRQTVQEKDSIIKNHFVEIIALRQTEENFKKQHEDSIVQLQSEFEEKQRLKNIEYEKALAELMQQKESVNDMQSNLEALWKQQLKDQAEHHVQELEKSELKWKKRLEKEKAIIKKKNEDLQRLAESEKIQNTELLKVHKQLGDLQQQQLTCAEETLEISTARELERNEFEKSYNKALDESSEKLMKLEDSYQANISICQSNISRLQEENQQLLENLSELGSEKASLNEEVKSLNENLKNSAEQLRKKESKFNQEVAQLQEELDRLTVSKDEEIANMRNEKNCRGAMYQKELQQLKDEHSAEIESLTMRISELVANDDKLQDNLKTLTEKLTETEVKLQECMQSYEVQFDQFQTKLEQQETEFSAERNVLLQKQKEAENQLQETVKSLQSVSEKILESEEYQERVTGVEEKWKSKTEEMKQKYAAKFKELHTQYKKQISTLEEQINKDHNDSMLKLTDLEKRIMRETEEKQALASELAYVNTQLLHLEETSGMSQSTLLDLERDLARMNEVNSKKLEEVTILQQELVSKDNTLETTSKLLNKIVEELKQKLEESECLCSEKSAELEKARETMLMLETNLTQQKETMEKRCSDFESTIRTNQNINEEKEKEFQEKMHELNEENARVVGELLSKVSVLGEEKENVRIYFETLLADTHLEHSLEMKMQSEKFEAETVTKVAEYKKRAEIYLTQFKKQMEVEKTGKFAEQQAIINILEEQLHQLQEEGVQQQHKEVKLLQLEEKQTENGHKRLVQKSSSVSELGQNSDSEPTDDLENSCVEKAKLVEKIAELELCKSRLEEDNKHHFESFEVEKSDFQEKIKELTTMLAAEREKYETLRAQHEEAIKDLEATHKSKIKQLMREVHQQLAEKEKTYEDTFSEALTRCEQEETRIIREHQREREELNTDLHEKSTQLEDLRHEYHMQLKEKEEEMSKAVSRLQQEMSALRDDHLKELQQQEERLRTAMRKQIEEHKEEVAALSVEWNNERKSVSMSPQQGSSDDQSQELVHQNQFALNAMQSGSASGELLRHQFIELTCQLESEKERHKLELAELQSQAEMKHNSLAKPLLASPVARADHLSDEIQNLELYNMDLQAQVAQLNGDLAKSHLKEQEMQQKMQAESQGSLLTTSDSHQSSPLYQKPVEGPLLREPTELEYLKNILYEYMMGKETKTLAKVIATVVHFTEEQTQKILSREESRTTSSWLSSP